MNAVKQTLVDGDFEMYRLTHRAMGREVDAVVRMIGALAAGDRVRPARLRTWLMFLERTLHHHHLAEDRWFFPLLERKDPGFADVRHLLDADHERLEPALRSTMDGLTQLTVLEGQSWTKQREQTLADATAFRDLLVQHLAMEEEEVIRRSKKALRPIHVETFNRKAMNGVPVSDLRTVLPWLLDSCDAAERERLIGRLTLGNRILYKLIWGPRYRKLTGVLGRS
jgi:hemerythrin-like domain-containing protein